MTSIRSRERSPACPGNRSELQPTRVPFSPLPSNLLIQSLPHLPTLPPFRIILSPARSNTHPLPSQHDLLFTCATRASPRLATRRLASPRVLRPPTVLPGHKLPRHHPLLSLVSTNTLANMSGKEKIPSPHLPTITPEMNIKSVILEYNTRNDERKTELSDLVLKKYKCGRNDVPLTAAAGSTTPLVDKPTADEDLGNYNPFEHRKNTHPTTDADTLIHLLKGSLGSGILAMPLAFHNSGLLFGVISTFIIGFICTYCVHILVKCSHILCYRRRVPQLGFSEVAEAAFIAGPPAVRKWARFASGCINLFLVVDLLGCCCVYIVFVAENLKQVIDFYTKEEWRIQIYMGIMIPFLLGLNCVRNLKWLAPFSMVANLLIASGLGITFYYVFEDLPSITNSGLPNFSSLAQLPLYFGTVIFALEGIGVVMPLENNMKTPTHFIGCPGVLNIGMAVVVSLYTAVGFFGYLKYGNNTKGSITLNLPNHKLAQSVKVMVAVAIFFTYGLQFYVPMQIIWKSVKHRFGSRMRIAEYIMRILLVLGTVAIAAAIPNLAPFISLVGAVCLSTLGLMFPSIIEIVTYWETPGMGRFHWRLWKNMLIILFGVLGFVTGTYSSIYDIVHSK